MPLSREAALAGRLGLGVGRGGAFFSVRYPPDIALGQTLCTHRCLQLRSVSTAQLDRGCGFWTTTIKNSCAKLTPCQGIFSLVWTDRKTELLLTHRLHMNADALRLRTWGTAVSACIFGKVVEVL